MSGSIRIKIKRLVIKLIIILVAAVAIYFLIKMISKFTTGTETQELTIEEKIKQKSDKPIFGGKISDEDKDRFSDYLDEYFQYCNNKEYEKAYNMLSDSCKEKLFPTIEKFQEEVDSIFDKLKMYEYQNYSDVDNMYVYELYVFDDIVAYGATSTPEKNIIHLAIIKDDNDNLKISLNGYLKTEKLNYRYNINNVEITIEKRDIYYDHVDFYIKFKNNTDKNIVFRYGDAKYQLQNGNRIAEFKNLNHIFYYLFISSNYEEELVLSFEKSFDTVKYQDLMIQIKNCYMLDNEKLNQLLSNEKDIEDMKETEVYADFNLSL